VHVAWKPVNRHENPNELINNALILTSF